MTQIFCQLKGNAPTEKPPDEVRTCRGGGSIGMARLCCYNKPQQDQSARRGYEEVCSESLDQLILAFTKTVSPWRE